MFIGSFVFFFIPVQVINSHFELSNFGLVLLLQTRDFSLHTGFSISQSGGESVDFELHVLSQGFQFFFLLLETTFHLDTEGLNIIMIMQFSNQK